MHKRQWIPMAAAFITGACFAQSLPTFDDIDANGDGAASPAEVNAALQGYDFAGADANSDGQLTREEYDAGIQAQTGGSGSAQ